MPAIYRIPLTDATTPSGRHTYKFKFELDVRLPGSPAAVRLPAALDTFDDISLLPPQTFTQRGGILAPVLVPPGTVRADCALDFSFPHAPAEIARRTFRVDPCRLETRLKPTERFRLNLRDIIPHFHFTVEEDASGTTWLVLALR